MIIQPKSSRNKVDSSNKLKQKYGGYLAFQRILSASDNNAPPHTLLAHGLQHLHLRGNIVPHIPFTFLSAIKQ